MSKTLLFFLILSEVFSAVLICRVWTRKLRTGIWERCCLTLALLAPFFGWLVYGFLEPSPDDRPPLKLLDEKTVKADPDRLELLWLPRSELDEALLEEMAAADGGMDQAENLEALVEILQTGVVSRTMRSMIWSPSMAASPAGAADGISTGAMTGAAAAAVPVRPTATGVGVGRVPGLRHGLHASEEAGQRERRPWLIDGPGRIWRRV